MFEEVSNMALSLCLQTRHCLYVFKHTIPYVFKHDIDLTSSNKALLNANAFNYVIVLMSSNIPFLMSSNMILTSCLQTMP